MTRLVLEHSTHPSSLKLLKAQSSLRKAKLPSPRVSGGHNTLSRCSNFPCSDDPRTRQDNSVLVQYFVQYSTVIELNLAIRNFASGHEARGGPQKAFPKRQPSNNLTLVPRNPLETLGGILPHALPPNDRRIAILLRKGYKRVCFFDLQTETPRGRVTPTSTKWRA